MLVLVVCMIAAFAKIHRCAALLNIPYLVWTAFAAYLTIGFCLFN
jgi:tryptophan-rich sensory protein